MILWTGIWREFDSDERYEQYILSELQWEVELIPSHPLHAKRCRIAGWMPGYVRPGGPTKGYDHFIVYVKGDGRYAYVQLIWRRDETGAQPYSEFLDDTDAVNRFVDKWSNATATSIPPAPPL